MPVVFRWNGHRFHFFANEGDPREPAHIHVSRAGATAKFWLSPDVELAYNRHFDARTIKRLQEIVEQHRAELEEAWNDFFA
ncbi:MAG TPA: DUF4160 domain-containing protein [Allosphingosinicella sp.]|jgi:hypothetical protein